MNAYDVLRISHAEDDIDRLKVEVAAATEMSFEVRRVPSVDYQVQLADICQVALALMRVDAALTEMADGADVRPTQEDVDAISRFRRKYVAHLRNVETGGLLGDV